MSEKKKKYSHQPTHTVLNMTFNTMPEPILSHLQALHGTQIQVDATWVTQDELAFGLRYSNARGAITAEVTGRLQRWQGTATRLIAEGRSRAPGFLWEWTLHVLLMSVITIALLIALAAYTSQYMLVYDWQAYNQWWFLPFALFLVMVWALTRPFFLRMFNHVQQQANRDLDTLVQKIFAAVQDESPLIADE